MKHCDVRIPIERNPSASPIVILVIEIEAFPGCARFPVNETGRERLSIPIALLNNAHLRAIRRDGAGDNPRPVEMPDEKCGRNGQKRRHTGNDNF
jgi:hypothetical protein